MREIKFRAWYPPITEQGQGTMSEEIFLESGILNTAISELEKENTVLMQYTGLKDKNGKGIYEGDIVKDEDENYEIKWNQLHCLFGKFQYGCMKNSITADWIEPNGETPKDWKSSSMEVIGNVYENPDLM